MCRKRGESWAGDAVLQGLAICDLENRPRFPLEYGDSSPLWHKARGVGPIQRLSANPITSHVPFVDTRFQRGACLRAELSEGCKAVNHSPNTHGGGLFTGIHADECSRRDGDFQANERLSSWCWRDAEGDGVEAGGDSLEDGDAGRGCGSVGADEVAAGPGEK